MPDPTWTIGANPLPEDLGEGPLIAQGPAAEPETTPDVEPEPEPTTIRHSRFWLTRQTRFGIAALLSFLILVSVVAKNWGKTHDANTSGKAALVTQIAPLAGSASDARRSRPASPPPVSRDEPARPPREPAPAPVPAAVVNDPPPARDDMLIAMADTVKLPGAEPAADATRTEPQKEPSKDDPRPVQKTEAPASAPAPAPVSAESSETGEKPGSEDVNHQLPPSPSPAPAPVEPATPAVKAIEAPAPVSASAPQPAPAAAPASAPSDLPMPSVSEPAVSQPVQNPAESQPRVEPPAPVEVQPESRPIEPPAPAGDKSPDLLAAPIAAPVVEPAPQPEPQTPAPTIAEPFAAPPVAPAPEPQTPAPTIVEPVAAPPVAPAPEPTPVPAEPRAPETASGTVSLPNAYSPGPAPKPAGLPNLAPAPSPAPESAPASKVVEAPRPSPPRAAGPDKWVALPSVGRGRSLEEFDRPAAPTIEPEPSPRRKSAAMAPIAPAPIAPESSSDDEPNPDREGQVEPVPHVVQRGENLFTISQLYYGYGRFWKALWAANRAIVPDPTKLYVGQTIRIPAPEDLDRSLIEAERLSRSGSRSDSGSSSAGAERPSPTSGSTNTPPMYKVSRPTNRGIELPTSDPFSDLDDRDQDEAETSQAPPPRRPSYKVRPNETLRSIARDVLGDSHRAREILELNPGVIDDPYNLIPGQRLELPEDARFGRPRD